MKKLLYLLIFISCGASAQRSISLKVASVDTSLAFANYIRTANYGTVKTLQALGVDTTLISTKANVTAKLIGYAAAANVVPYTGATGAVNLGTNTLASGAITTSGTFKLAGSNSGSTPFALGSSSPRFQFTNGGAYGLVGDILTTGDSYLQATRVDATATAYNLQLQPLGGSVIVGGAATFSSLAGTGNRIVQADASGTLTATNTIASGTYTPTYTPQTNVSAILASSPVNYIRIGNIVTVTGTVQFTVTANASNTVVSWTLPISSALTNATDLEGTVTISGPGGYTSGFSSKLSTSGALQFTSNSTGSFQAWYSYSYLID